MKYLWYRVGNGELIPLSIDRLDKNKNYFKIKSNKPSLGLELSHYTVRPLYKGHLKGTWKCAHSQTCIQRPPQGNLKMWPLVCEDFKSVYPALVLRTNVSFVSSYPLYTGLIYSQIFIYRPLKGTWRCAPLWAVAFYIQVKITLLCSIH